MSENVSRVIPPNNANTIDYDFLAFSFGEFHSWDNFNIYRVIDGDRYTTELNPQITDRTAETPGADGMMFFGSNHKSKVFNIKIAFENITDAKIRSMRKWLNGKEVKDLWFDEEPYKVYSAKVTGQPSISFIPFDKKNNETGQIERVYSGEGTIQFTAYWPYAHTPDYIGSSGTASGKIASSYNSFRNKNQWIASSSLTNTTGACTGENPGDIPAPFILTHPGEIGAGASKTFIVGDCSITVGGTGQSKLSNIVWDSKTGMVSAKIGDDTVAKPIAYSGNSLGAIPVDGLGSDKIQLNGATLKYHYWYY